MNGFSNSSMPDNLYAFSMTSLMDIMKEFSDISIPRVAIGYILMVCFHFIFLHTALDKIKKIQCLRLDETFLYHCHVILSLSRCHNVKYYFNFQYCEHKCRVLQLLDKKQLIKDCLYDFPVINLDQFSLLNSLSTSVICC